jgi:hypothetical protein
MFHSTPPVPTKAKHVIYLLATTILGVLLLGLLGHILVESLYLRWASDTNHIIIWYEGCALHPVLQYGLLVIGAVGGFFIGRLWWRIVYVEQKWVKK